MNLPGALLSSLIWAHCSPGCRVIDDSSQKLHPSPVNLIYDTSLKAVFVIIYKHVEQQCNARLVPHTNHHFVPFTTHLIHPVSCALYISFSSGWVRLCMTLSFEYLSWVILSWGAEDILTTQSWPEACCSWSKQNIPLWERYFTALDIVISCNSQRVRLSLSLSKWLLLAISPSRTSKVSLLIWDSLHWSLMLIR